MSQHKMPFSQALYRVTQKAALAKVSTGLKHALNSGPTVFTYTDMRYREKICLAVWQQIIQFYE